MRGARIASRSSCRLPCATRLMFTHRLSLLDLLPLFLWSRLRWSCLSLCDLRRLCCRLLVRRRRCDVDGIRFVDALFEAFDSFSESFAQLWDFARPENDQDNDQNQEQLHPPE